jgi:hypothetical protein
MLNVLDKASGLVNYGREKVLGRRRSKARRGWEAKCRLVAAI